jgi:hypothetical protein
MRNLFASRIWMLLVLPALVFTLLAYFTEDRALILVFNIAQAATATAVVVAFTPEAMRILWSKAPMNRGSWMAYGIWVGWGFVLYGNALSLVWRFMGQPAWLVNSDWVSVRFFGGIIAATCHIIKPGELNEKVPTREMIRIAVILGAAVAVGLTVVNWPEIQSAWRGKHAWMTTHADHAIAGPAPSRDVATRNVDPDILHEIAPTDGPDDLSSRIEARISRRLNDRIEDWRTMQRPVMSRAGAVRQLLDEALDAEDKAVAEPFEPEGR